MKKNIQRTRAILIMIMLIAINIIITSCAPMHTHVEGLDNFCDSNGAYSEYSIASGLFLKADFVKKYTYIDGNFVYDYYGSLLTEEVDRAFAWITYNDEIYLNAKQDAILEDAIIINEEGDIFGFTFYLKTEWHFPNWFTAVGYNDISKTLVFIGFYADGKEEAKKFAIAKTDFAAFLNHYYGEWYNWE